MLTLITLLVIALLYTLSYPFCVAVLKSARDRRLAKEANIKSLQVDDTSREGSTTKRHDEIKLSHLICIARFFFGLAS